MKLIAQMGCYLHKIESKKRRITYRNNSYFGGLIRVKQII